MIIMLFESFDRCRLDFKMIAVRLQKTNTTKLRWSKSKRILLRFSLKCLGRLAPVKSFIDRLESPRWSRFRRVILLLDRVTLRAFDECNLQVPEDLANRLDKPYIDAVDCYGLHRQNSGARLT